MACYSLQMEDSSEFYSKLKSRDPDLVLKMSKCVLEVAKYNKERIDIFDITFKRNLDGILFSINKSQYEDLLNNCLNDLIKIEEYELCADIKKILNKKTL
jgi:hypothetical protein